MNTIKSVLANKDAVSLMLLSQVNFGAGLQMMKRLREDEKARKTTEDSARNDREVEDSFASCAATVDTTPTLDVSASLVVASLLAAQEIRQDNAEFLRKNLRTPKSVIVSSLDWMADKEAQTRLMTAQKFGLTVSVDIARDVIKAKQNDILASYTTEAQSAVPNGLTTWGYDDLVELIEDTYTETKWQQRLNDSVMSLYEGAVKRIQEGKFADLPDEIIDYANTIKAD